MIELDEDVESALLAALLKNFRKEAEMWDASNDNLMLLMCIDKVLSYIEVPLVPD